ncbi:MAG: type II toxin-antitoxin system RelE/ParE family toxin [Verrucomicrobiae bacterium]
MIFRVEVSKSVEKFLLNLRDVALKRRLVSSMRTLADDPRPPGCIKLSGSKDLYRVRVGDYRILYQVRNSEILVVVLEIGNRREIYR